MGFRIRDRGVGGRVCALCAERHAPCAEGRKQQAESKEQSDED